MASPYGIWEYPVIRCPIVAGRSDGMRKCCNKLIWTRRFFPDDLNTITSAIVHSHLVNRLTRMAPALATCSAVCWCAGGCALVAVLVAVFSAVTCVALGFSLCCSRTQSKEDFIICEVFGTNMWTTCILFNHTKSRCQAVYAVRRYWEADRWVWKRYCVAAMCVCCVFMWWSLLAFVFVPSVDDFDYVVSHIVWTKRSHSRISRMRSHRIYYAHLHVNSTIRKSMGPPRSVNINCKCVSVGWSLMIWFIYFFRKVDANIAYVFTRLSNRRCNRHKDDMCEKPIFKWLHEMSQFVRERVFPLVRIMCHRDHLGRSSTRQKDAFAFVCACLCVCHEMRISSVEYWTLFVCILYTHILFRYPIDMQHNFGHNASSDDKISAHTHNECAYLQFIAWRYRNQTLTGVCMFNSLSPSQSICGQFRRMDLWPASTTGICVV